MVKRPDILFGPNLELIAPNFITGSQPLARSTQLLTDTPLTSAQIIIGAPDPVISDEASAVLTADMTVIRADATNFTADAV